MTGVRRRAGQGRGQHNEREVRAVGGPPGGPGTHPEDVGPEQEQEVAPPCSRRGAVALGPHILRFCSRKLPGTACCCHSLSSNLAACLRAWIPGHSCLRDTFPTWKQRCPIRQVLAQVRSPGETDLPSCPPHCPTARPEGSEGHSGLCMAVWDHPAPQGPRDCCWLRHCQGSGSRNVPGLTESWPRNSDLC